MDSHALRAQMQNTFSLAGVASVIVTTLYTQTLRRVSLLAAFAFLNTFI